MRRMPLLAAAMLLAFIYLAGFLPAAAETFTLDADSAIRLAIENNLSLKSGRIDLAAAARAKKNAWNEFLPQITASVSLSRSNQVTAVMGVEPSPWNLGFSLEAVLPLSAAAINSIHATVLDYEAGLIDYETAEIQLERDVRKAFYGLILAQERIRLAEQELATAVRRYQQTLENYQAGLVPRLEALSTQVSAENLKPALEQQRVAYATSLMDFRLFLGLGSEDELAPKGAIEVEKHSFDAEALARRYTGDRLDIQNLLKQLEILENQKRLQERSSLRPTLSFGVSFSPALNDPFGAAWGDDDSWADSGRFRLALALPLDGFVPGSSNQLALAGLDDSIEKAHLALEQARRKAANEVESIVLRLEKSLRSLDALELNVALAQEAYDLNEEAYAAGTEELLEVQNAADNLQNAKLNLLNEKYNYLSGLIDLEYALGKTLTELEENRD